MNKLMHLTVLIYLLTSCSLAPKYQQPLMPIPEHFKETGTWVPAKAPPATAVLVPWWSLFNDATLNELEERVSIANQDLKIAFFHYQEAKALLQVARAGFFPTVQGLANANRVRTSRTIALPTNPYLYNNFLIGGDVSYEVDVWGRIRNMVTVSQNRTKASAADLVAVSLSLHAELASNYFALRGCDESQRILDNTVIAYQKALYLTKKRYSGGASPAVDVDNAQTQLENAKTMATDMRLKRAQLEHAIAVLIGEIPSNFSLAPGRMPKNLLLINPDLPSTLMERRPDIASAEALVKAANANIGIARAAFFPEFNLTSVIGFQSKMLSNLISKPSLFWSLGPIAALTLSQPLAQMTLFDGGRLLGLLKQANANYYETVAAYRQTVLTAFQEVEDNLMAIKQLDQENRSQKAATLSARRALTQAQNRYRGGIITFLDVVVTENIALQAELAQVNLITRRQIASIQLIKSLGGSSTR